MYVAIDEAGDSGFKFRRGSTRYCVICLVVIDDILKVENSIKKVKRKLNLDNFYEFHFSKCKNNFRKVFFDCLINLRTHLRIRCIIIDKHKIFSEYLRKQNFYDYFTKLILQYDNGILEEAILYIDNSRNKTEKFSFNKYINQQINLKGKTTKKIKRIGHYNSRNISSVQIADMCAGAILRKYSKTDLTFYEKIKPLIEDEWCFSENKKPI